MKFNTGLGAELDSSLSKLDAALSDSTLDFLAGLWDTDIGGFYYSVSARDCKGFLPDAESTAQILKLLFSGAIKGTKGNLASMLGEDIKEKISKFILSLKDGDGYFYHPQWGKDISTVRRERDLALCREILDSLEPKADEKGDTDKKKTPKPSASASKPPERLKSRDDLIRFLGDSDDIASSVRAQYKQIKDAGLTDVLLDYLDELQENVQRTLRDAGERESGCWQTECGYGAMSELYKLASIYNEHSRSIKYGAALVDSCTAVILSDEPTKSISQIYTPWAALVLVLKNMALKLSDEERSADRGGTYAKIRRQAPELIEKTTKKLKVYKKHDGGYSYYPECAAPYSLGVRVSLGIEEGDVNSTVTAVHGIRGSIFSALGLTAPPIWDECEITEIINKLGSATQAKKISSAKFCKKHRIQPSVH